MQRDEKDILTPIAPSRSVGVYPEVQEHALPGQSPEMAVENAAYNIVARPNWKKVVLLGLLVAPTLLVCKLLFTAFLFAAWSAGSLPLLVSSAYAGYVLPIPLAGWFIAMRLSAQGVAHALMVAICAIFSIIGMMSLAWAWVPFAAKSGNGSPLGYGLLLIPWIGGALVLLVYAYAASSRKLSMVSVICMLVVSAGLFFGSMPIATTREKGYMASLDNLSFTPLEPVYVPAGTRYDATCDTINAFGHEEARCHLTITDPKMWFEPATQDAWGPEILAKQATSEAAEVEIFRYHPWLEESLPSGDGKTCDLGAIFLSGSDVRRRSLPVAHSARCERVMGDASSRYTIWTERSTSPGTENIEYYNYLYAHIQDQVVFVSVRNPEHLVKGSRTVDELARMINSYE